MQFKQQILSYKISSRVEKKTGLQTVERCTLYNVHSITFKDKIRLNSTFHTFVIEQLKLAQSVKLNCHTQLAITEFYWIVTYIFAGIGIGNRSDQFQRIEISR